MRLFKTHAVMPLVGLERAHVVRTYVAIAPTWQQARERVRCQEPAAEFITVPCEMPDVLMTDVSSMSEMELTDLRSACTWNETRLRNGDTPR